LGLINVKLIHGNIADMSAKRKQALTAFAETQTRRPLFIQIFLYSKLKPHRTPLRPNMQSCEATECRNAHRCLQKWGCGTQENLRFPEVIYHHGDNLNRMIPALSAYMGYRDLNGW